MGKYTYLNAQEIISEVEKFGTDDERDLVAKLGGEPDWDRCPNCDNAHDQADRSETDAAEAREDLDELKAGIGDAYTKISSAVALLEQAQEDME